ncbi:MAG TPA: DUF6526 family protein [Candidatus Acidoferrales bacterium]|nr:DUF6526 family protein [Candidatus Acidoferrales bacterium]
MAQNYSNHRKFVPAFHFFTLPVLLLNVGYQVTQSVRFFSSGTVIGALTAVAILLAALFGRVFALKVQDRVIRLEMRLRLMEVLPPELRARIAELTLDQLVGLRFASDGELPELTRKALTERTKRDDLKKAVTNWQADEVRA